MDTIADLALIALGLVILCLVLPFYVIDSGRQMKDQDHVDR